jgi:hypothetical protein
MYIRGIFDKSNQGVGIINTVGEISGLVTEAGKFHFKYFL